MVFINGQYCENESLIELCAPPNININLILKEISIQNPNSIFIENTLNLKLIGLNTVYITDFRVLLEKLDEIKQTWLFIDSISLYVDNVREFGTEKDLKNIYNKIWELIYESQVTVIVTNHFKIKRGSIYHELVPRLGFNWYKICSYRVLINSENDKITYNISKNSGMIF